MMAEEFVDDIIGSGEAPKTEKEMAATLQGLEADKAPEKQVETPDKAELGSEATPDVVQDDKGKATESDDVKALAAQLGWREDHNGADAVDAKTYILKSKDIQKSMSKHNRDLKDQLMALDGSVSALKKHNESVYQAEVKKLTGEINALKKERRSAIELADVAKVDELDKQIDDIQKDIDAPKPTDEQREDVVDNPVYDEWIEGNEWYLEDAEMAAFADTIAQQYVGAPLERIYAIVSSRVKEIFPDKFESTQAPAKEHPEPAKVPVGPKSPVESSSAKGTEGSFTKADLTPDQMQIMRQFVQGGIMTEDQYVNDIAKMQ